MTYDPFFKQAGNELWDDDGLEDEAIDDADFDDEDFDDTVDDLEEENIYYDLDSLEAEAAEIEEELEEEDDFALVEEGIIEDPGYEFDDDDIADVVDLYGDDDVILYDTDDGFADDDEEDEDAYYDDYSL